MGCKLKKKGWRLTPADAKIRKGDWREQLDKLASVMRTREIIEIGCEDVRSVGAGGRDG